MGSRCVAFVDGLRFSRASQLCCGVTRPTGKLGEAENRHHERVLMLAACFVHETATRCPQGRGTCLARLGVSQCDENLLSGRARRPRETHTYFLRPVQPHIVQGTGGTTPSRKVRDMKKKVVGIMRRATPNIACVRQVQRQNDAACPTGLPGRTSRVHAEWCSTRNPQPNLQPNRR